jgi:hypothetical protein
MLAMLGMLVMITTITVRVTKTDDPWALSSRLPTVDFPDAELHADFTLKF